MALSLPPQAHRRPSWRRRSGASCSPTSRRPTCVTCPPSREAWTASPTTSRACAGGGSLCSSSRWSECKARAAPRRTGQAAVVECGRVGVWVSQGFGCVGKHACGDGIACRAFLDFHFHASRGALKKFYGGLVKTHYNKCRYDYCTVRDTVRVNTLLKPYTVVKSPTPCISNTGSRTSPVCAHERVRRGSYINC